MSTTARARLTVLYGGLFLLSGAALMAIAYALLVNAGFVFTVGGGSTTPVPETRLLSSGPAALVGSIEHASPQTLAHWRGVAACMRRDGVVGFPDPRSSVPDGVGRFREISDRDGAIFAIPLAVDMTSPVFQRAGTVCGFAPDHTRAIAQANRRRAQARHALLIESGIALAAMSLLSLGLGWLMAGRVLAPLEESYEAQRQFVANASHELRAPLARQRALIEVALADPVPDVGSLTIAHERSLASEQHLEQIIDGLLALAHGQAGLERREPLDLATLASHSTGARESQLADLSLELRLALALAPARGDPRLVERLIDNLVDNAARHNIRGGHVEIATGVRRKRPFVLVANTGEAIPPEEVPRLLKPFQRLGPARTQHEGGHGLGLSIVQAIAAAHRAELTARARPGGGLIVEVTFPAISDSGSAATAATGWIRRWSLRTSIRE